MPLRDGEWTPAALAQARIVARLRDRGHSLDALRDAAHSGRLAYGYMEELGLEKLARDAKLIELGAGTTDINLLAEARELIGLHDA